MQRIEKFKSSERKIFFCSDWHIGQLCKDWEKPIWELRGFDNREAHTDFIINKTNEVVGEEDIIYNLGDPFLNTSEEEFEFYISRINCKNLRLCPGNHPNPGIHVYRREVDKFFKSLGVEPEEREIYPFRYKNVLFVGEYIEVFIDKIPIVLHHFPLKTWNYMKRNGWHIFGHEHLGTSDGDWGTLDQGKCAEVSVESLLKYNGGAPVEFKQLKAWMDRKPRLEKGHH